MRKSPIKNPKSKVENRKSKIENLARYLVLAFALLAALSYWLPWVAHPTAALKLSGQDMGEFVKFIPAFRNGEIGVPRQLFYLPPLVCTLVLTLIGINRAFPWPRWLRVLILGIALLLLSGLLPPVWSTPKDWFNVEFRLQGLGLVLGGLFVLAHGAFRRLPLPWLSLPIFLLAVTGLFPAQWAFWQFKPYVWAVYDTPTIHVGWGVWLNGIAWVGLAVTMLAVNRSANHAKSLSENS